MNGYNKHIKMIRLLILSNLVTLITLCIVLNRDNVVLSSPTDIVKTVAHVDVNNSNLELIYKDADNDIAYYRYTGNVGKLVEEKDILTTCYGDNVEVIYTDIYGFKVKSDVSVIHPGMSGTALENVNGDTVGYVSTILEDNVVYCIWK